MRYRNLGNSDLSVSEVSLGSWLTYGVGVDRDRALRCVDRAFELGVNFIDTANVYGRGAAETFLGEALAKRSRDSYVLATKVFFPMSDSDRGLSRAQILKQIDASLTRLPQLALGLSVALFETGAARAVAPTSPDVPQEGHAVHASSAVTEGSGCMDGVPGF